MERELTQESQKAHSSRTQTVEKTRVLYFVGQDRVHLDSVDGVGDFLELEVVLLLGQDCADGQSIAAELMHRLGIRCTDLRSTAHADMLGDSWNIVLPRVDLFQSQRRTLSTADTT